MNPEELRVTGGISCDSGRQGRGLDRVLRALGAVPLSYGVASLWVMALARLLPGDRAQATVFASLAGFAICAAAAMWAFAARSGWRAFWTLLVAGALGGGIAAVSIGSGGRL